MERSDERGLPDGVYSAVLTPMDAQLAVDSRKYADHCRWLLANGCDGLAVMGTTGEANSFTVQERLKAIEDLVAAGISAGRLMVGTGCCAVPDTIELTRHALGLGAGGVLMLPPFYYKQVSDEGIFSSIATVVETVGDDRLKIFLYHFPRMTGIPFSDSVLERLIAAFPGTIAGMKDSGGDWEHMRRLCERFPGFRMFAGTERYLLNILDAGGAGCISASTNVSCPQAQEVYQAWRTENAAAAAEAQARLSEVRGALEVHPFVPGLKQVMAQRTGDEGWMHMRPPNVPLDEASAASLMDSLQTLGVM
jgi:4-hydroxy-tetrahydrodipicolinate synthase